MQDSLIKEGTSSPSALVQSAGNLKKGWGLRQLRACREATKQNTNEKELVNTGDKSTSTEYDAKTGTYTVLDDINC